ncbi:hypothetical protein JB92DRAFT_2839394 [Gautieria morchelliformis]|nr:hypothetical protein JB92DRAFT_2839394 [Gautieria morchelliformis]
MARLTRNPLLRFQMSLSSAVATRASVSSHIHSTGHISRVPLQSHPRHVCRFSYTRYHSSSYKLIIAQAADLAGATSELRVEPGDMFFAKCLQAALGILRYVPEGFFAMGMFCGVFLLRCSMRFVEVLTSPATQLMGRKSQSCMGSALAAAAYLTTPTLTAAFPDLLDAGMQWYLHRNSMTWQTAIFITFHWIFHWLWVHKSQKIRLLAQDLTNEKQRRNH